MKIYEYISWLPHFSDYMFSCDQIFVWKSNAYLFIKILWKKSRQVSSLSMQHGSYFMVWQHIFIDVLVWSCIWKIVEKYCIHALFLAQHKQTLPRNIPIEYSVRISVFSSHLIFEYNFFFRSMKFRNFRLNFYSTNTKFKTFCASYLLSFFKKTSSERIW